MPDLNYNENFRILSTYIFYLLSFICVLKYILDKPKCAFGFCSPLEMETFLNRNKQITTKQSIIITKNKTCDTLDTISNILTFLQNN